MWISGLTRYCSVSVRAEEIFWTSRWRMDSLEEMHPKLWPWGPTQTIKGSQHQPGDSGDRQAAYMTILPFPVDIYHTPLHFKPFYFTSLSTRWLLPTRCCYRMQEKQSLQILDQSKGLLISLIWLVAQMAVTPPAVLTSWYPAIMRSRYHSTVRPRINPLILQSWFGFQWACFLSTLFSRRPRASFVSNWCLLKGKAKHKPLSYVPDGLCQS